MASVSADPLPAFRLPGLPAQVKLGRVIPRVPRAALRFGALLPRAVPPAPPAWDGRRPGAKWPMDGNDRVGDCVLASCAHMIGLWTLDAGPAQVTFTDAVVLGWYSAITGYDPARPWTDQGTVIEDALNYWIAPGLSGHTIPGWVAVDPTRPDLLRLAYYVFGGGKVGLAMPAAWQSQTGPGRVWDTGPNERGPWEPGSWGGHDVSCVGYDADGLTVITWGAEQRITWRALAAYSDRCYAAPSWEWLRGPATPTGVNPQDFADAFASLGGGPLTPPTPVPPVPPPPPPPGQGVISIDLDARTVRVPGGWTTSSGSGVRI
jgi:hypothetical protein